MPAPDPKEQTHAAIRHMLKRIDTCIKTLVNVADAMETAGPQSLVIRYGKSIATALNTLEGFSRDANNSYADAVGGNPRTLPASAPGRAPGGKKPAPVSASAKANQSTRKRTTKKAAK